MARLNQERQQTLEPKRREMAIQEIEKLGIKITCADTDHLEFIWKERLVKYFVYSGWATGKTIKDGRGLENLLKQLK